MKIIEEISSSPRHRKVQVKPSWAAVVVAEFEELFATTGTMRPACIVIPKLSEFCYDLYVGEQLWQDPVLSVVYGEANAKGYNTPRHCNGDGKLKKGFLVLCLDDSISVGQKESNAFWVTKYTASVQWEILDLRRLEEKSKPNRVEQELATV